jgi:hypothetical protein
VRHRDAVCQQFSIDRLVFGQGICASWCGELFGDWEIVSPRCVRSDTTLGSDFRYRHWPGSAAARWFSIRSHFFSSNFTTNYRGQSCCWCCKFFFLDKSTCLYGEKVGSLVGISVHVFLLTPRSRGCLVLPIWTLIHLTSKPPRSNSYSTHLGNW